MQSASSRIWTRVAVSISYDDNHYTTGTSKLCVTVIILEIESATQVQILGEAVWVSPYANGYGNTSSNPGRGWLHFT